MQHLLRSRNDIKALKKSIQQTRHGVATNFHGDSYQCADWFIMTLKTSNTHMYKKTITQPQSIFF